jgi:DNA-binding beta-propeller fold protein YncE
MKTMVGVVCVFAMAGLLPAQQASPLRLVQSIPLPSDIKGRMDHLDVDGKGKRLFVAALENGTVEVIDLQSGAWERRIAGLRNPQGVLYLKILNKLFVTSGGDATLKTFSGDSLTPQGSVSLHDGANRLIYDARRSQLYVGCDRNEAGQTLGEVAIVDAKSLNLLGAIPVNAHPAELLLDRGGGRLFVFLPAPAEIDVVDLKRRQTESVWAIKNERPGDAAYDARSNRLFVGTRTPAEMLVLDAKNGAQMCALPTPAGMDGVSFDEKEGLAFVSGGRGQAEGSIYVYSFAKKNRCRFLGAVPTRPGAGTSVWSSELRRFFVAAPATEREPASILVFEPVSGPTGQGSSPSR